jgi:hypothetical protein
MAVSSAGLRPKSDCSGNAQKQLYCKLQTHPLVREGATKIINPYVNRRFGEKYLRVSLFSVGFEVLTATVMYVCHLLG